MPFFWTFFGPHVDVQFESATRTKADIQPTAKDFMSFTSSRTFERCYVLP